jgi:UDP-N-acetyl-2-amino-2-deoxyglucuronate dehydrogenase
VAWEADLDALLARRDIDVVSVCVPSGLHADVGARATRAGKHLVVEKPIDVTVAAADRLLNAAESAGVLLTVISQHRFDAGPRRLQELVDEGRLGRLILGDAIIKWYRSQGYYESGDWRGTWALDGGGALMNQGLRFCPFGTTSRASTAAAEQEWRCGRRGRLAVTAPSGLATS